MSVRIVKQPRKIRGITVMCGRETGRDPSYVKAAHDLGMYCATEGVIGYFGGSQFGLMGAFANGLIGHGGKVVGIMPVFLREVEKPLDSIPITWVNDFDDRLKHFRDPEKVDAIVNLPGGIGTDAEHADFATRDKHDQLGLPNILVNIGGFYDYRILDFRRRFAEGFLWETPARRLFVADTVEDVLPMARAFHAGETLQNIFNVRIRAETFGLKTA